MSGPPPTSIVLPAIRWTGACDDVADQLGPGDELLVVCDDESDFVVDRDGDLPDGVRLVFAGEPERCPGKANAITAGMEAAEHDRLVWTDDDFHHPPNWLSRSHADYAERGPVPEVPFLVGRDPVSVLLEPIYAIGGTLGAYANDKAWSGCVVFEHDDLDGTAFLRDLRRTVSDDGLLSEHLENPELLVQAQSLAYGLARRTFVRGGRRYRWRSKFDVVVLP